jgi:hypothetical protein
MTSRAILSGQLRPVVGEMDELALHGPINGSVRLVNKALQPFRESVITAGLPAFAVHALLDDDPLAGIGHDEPVQTCTVALSTLATSRTLWPARLHQTQSSLRS